MRLCLVRHGETDWNVEGRLQGWTDIPLNATGEAQARAVATALAGTTFEAIYSSPLQRALATARAIAGGRPIHQEPRLRERHFGELQGLTRGEIAASHPAVQAELNARRPGYQPPGGESLQQFAARVHGVLSELRQRHPGGQQLLLVAHGGVLDIAYRLASDQDLHSPRLHALPNAAINWLCSTPSGWRVERWGEDEHLRGQARDEL